MFNFIELTLPTTGQQPWEQETQKLELQVGGQGIEWPDKMWFPLIYLIDSN